MLTEYNIKRHYDSEHADGVYGKLKGCNQELKVDLFKVKRAARTMLCLLLFGPLLKKFANPWPTVLSTNSKKNLWHFRDLARIPNIYIIHINRVPVLCMPKIKENCREK